MRAHDRTNICSGSWRWPVLLLLLPGMIGLAASGWLRGEVAGVTGAESREIRQPWGVGGSRRTKQQTADVESHPFARHAGSPAPLSTPREFMALPTSGIARPSSNEPATAVDDRVMHDAAVQPCQVAVPMIYGVDCDGCGPHGEADWNQWGPIPFQSYHQGEYVAPPRMPHVPVYRIRVDDELTFIYRLTRERSLQPYELNVGDVIVVESMTDETLNRGNLVAGQGIEILGDGTITLRLLGQIRAAGRTVDELRDELEERYTRYYQVPAITVTPLKVNARLEDLRAAVDARFGPGGQQAFVRVTPEGTIQLPAIGSVPAVGLTLDEIALEINERYRAIVTGIEVTPVLSARAPSYVFVVGEVRDPGRFTLEGPTTVIQSISLAGGWLHSGNLRQVVVFRRTADWRLMATKLDLRGALLGKRPCPSDEIMLRDLDIVIVPRNGAQLSADFVDLVFTRNIYGVLPFGASASYTKASGL